VSCDAGSPTPDVAPSPQESSRGGRVTFGVLGEPPTLDPYSDLATDLTRTLARPVYRSLFRVLPDGTVAPDLVSLDDVTRVPRGVVVELEPARWSDGKPVTARDVVRSVARADPPSGFAGLEAEVMGKRRVRLRGDVSGDWPRRLALGTYVVPARRDLRVASGAFVATRYEPGLEVVYEPNPEWGRDPPLLDRVTIRFVSSTQMLLELLERGRLDAAALPSAINLDERLEEAGIAYAEVRGWETITLDLNQVPERALRSTIVAAIDQEHIEQGLIRDEGRSTRVRPPKLLGGAPAGTQIQLATATGDELLQLMQRVLQKHLAAEQIEAELVQIDPATLYGEWDVDGPVDVALRRGVVAPSFRAPRVPKDLSSYPLFYVNTFVAFEERLRGIAPNGTTDGPLWNVHQWWLE